MNITSRLAILSIFFCALPMQALQDLCWANIPSDID
jgi:hypothetical protein